MIHTFQGQANVTQDFIMKKVEQRKDEKETGRNNNFSARFY